MRSSIYQHRSDDLTPGVGARWQANAVFSYPYYPVHTLRFSGKLVHFRSRLLFFWLKFRFVVLCFASDIQRCMLVSLPSLYRRYYSLYNAHLCGARIGPVAQYHENSRYFSAVRPVPNPEVDKNLPHITIQLPVYKESLDQVM
jgi:hypothetical protein